MNSIEITFLHNIDSTPVVELNLVRGYISQSVDAAKQEGVCSSDGWTRVWINTQGLLRGYSAKFEEDKVLSLLGILRRLQSPEEIDIIYKNLPRNGSKEAVYLWASKVLLTNNCLNYFSRHLK